MAVGVSAAVLLGALSVGGGKGVGGGESFIRIVIGGNLYLCYRQSISHLALDVVPPSLRYGGQAGHYYGLAVLTYVRIRSARLALPS